MTFTLGPGQLQPYGKDGTGTQSGLGNFWSTNLH